MFRCSEEHVRRRAKSGAWPHLRDGKRYLFTTAQISEIRESMVPKPVEPSGRGQRGRIARLLHQVSLAEVEQRMNRSG